MVRRLIPLTAALSVATCLTACGQAPVPTAAPGTTAATTPAEDPPSPVVGEWTRINSCDAFVNALERADLDRLVTESLISAGYFLRTDQVSPMKPCEGAVEDRNSSFFEPSGRFGSLDQDDVLVDDGTYTALDDSSIAIVGETSGRRFRVDFRIVDGRIHFHVSMPAACTGECGQDLAWVLSMFYPGALIRVT